MSINRTYRAICRLLALDAVLAFGGTMGVFGSSPIDTSTSDVGFAYDAFPLTLQEGQREEIAGPFYYREHADTLKIWAIPPVFSYSADSAIPMVEMNLAYPVFSYIRYGDQFRVQLFQLLSFAGGPSQTETVRNRVTLFPIYFQQRSSDPSQEYTAYGPFYGHLQNRLFRDEIEYVLFPAYSKTRKRDVTTRNYAYPFVHVREGDALQGWQVWPFYGEEHKGVTTKTNRFGDVEVVAGHQRSFVLWPFFANQQLGLGTENPQWQQVLLPLYNIFRSPSRDATTILWPLFTWIDDRERRYREWQLPWPFIGYARGEGKEITRFWPFYSHAANTNLHSDALLWPVYKHYRLRSAPLDRQRTRILFFLYSNLQEKDTGKNRSRHRIDLWPLFTHRRDYNGNERLQVLALLETVFPENHNIAIEYSSAYSLWRAEKNPRTGVSSQSLLWNLYRREVTPDFRKTSAFFGLYQSRKDLEGKHLKLFYIPIR